MSELAPWDSFYVIVGSAAGALVGLQFVVMTLIAEKPPRAPEAGAAFATPTVMHFSSVLLLSALLRAPWASITLVERRRHCAQRQHRVGRQRHQHMKGPILQHRPVVRLPPDAQAHDDRVSRSHHPEKAPKRRHGRD